MPCITVMVHKTLDPNLDPNLRGKCSREWAHIVAESLGCPSTEVEVIWPPSPKTWYNPMSMEILIEFSVSIDPEHRLSQKKIQAMSNSIAASVAIFQAGISGWGSTGVWARPIVGGIYLTT